MLWLFPYDEMIDHPEKLRRYVPELAKDRGHEFIEKTQILHTVVLGSILYAFGGWSYVVWGIFARAVFVYHCTWSVNSLAHMYGYQTFETNEGSRNNWFVALLTFGEGWHNNHHAYPNSAAHGLRWWEIDPTYFTIKLLSWVGLADGIRLPRGNPAKLSSPGEVIRPGRLPIPVPVEV